MIKDKNIDPAANINGSKLLAGSVALASLTAASLNGTAVANTANAGVIGGIPVVHMFSVADTGAATTDTDITLTHKTKILYVIVVKTSTASLNNGANTVQILNGTSAITDAIDIRNIADKTVKLCGTIDDAQQTISAGGTLRLERVAASATDDNAVDVYVVGVRSA